MSAMCCKVVWCVALARTDGVFCPIHAERKDIRPVEGTPTVNCDECGGDGKCPSCNGEGDCTCHCGDEHECHDCDGAGTCPRCGDDADDTANIPGRQITEKMYLVWVNDEYPQPLPPMYRNEWDTVNS